MAAHTQATDPATMNFIGTLHTLSNEARAFKAKIDSMKNQWNGGLNANFGNNADTWDEGRETEGIVPITSLQISQIVGLLLAIGTGGANELNAQIVAAMCVGPLSAQ